MPISCSLNRPSPARVWQASQLAGERTRGSRQKRAGISSCLRTKRAVRVIRGGLPAGPGFPAWRSRKAAISRCWAASTAASLP
jgi:hypothetical protein